MSTLAELLDHPVSPAISDAVWKAHEEQVTRNKTAPGVQARGEIRWSLAAGFQFFPEDTDEADRIAELVSSTPDWHVGAKCTITL